MRTPARRALLAATLVCLVLGSATVTDTPQAQAATPGQVSSAEATAPAPQVAATPPMGFNDWNAFGCSVNQELIEQTADFLVSSGLRDAGYRYVNIDDCWSLKERAADGTLVADPVKFPGGISAVADYVHKLGLKLGIYGDAGTKTCAGYPGSLGQEQLDARTWAGWGIDYLKYDNCYSQSDGSQADYIARYTAMRKALDASGRTIVYSMSEWGTSKPWTWATGVANLWRTTGDISDNWSSVRSIIKQNAPLAEYAGPGHWNDPDMLEVGNGGMTSTEYRTHLSMWAMMAAPLIMGTDLRKATAETLAILGNKEIIAVDQDRLGAQGTVVVDSGGLMVLDKPLAGGDHAIALYNSADTLATVSVPVTSTGLRPARAYQMRDLWSGNLLEAKTTISAGVPAHGTVVYRVRPLADPLLVAPSVALAGSLGVLVPGQAGTLATTATNRGAVPIEDLRVSVDAPAGWTVTATSDSARHHLGTDATLETTWSVMVPEGTSAGAYPITISTGYTWGARNTAASTVSELVTLVVTAPADGRRHLGNLQPISTSNAVGPVEIDQSNGGSSQGDGALITIAGRYYDHGIGTTAPSEIDYYLGGGCSQLVTDVGVDDEASAATAATFTVYADGQAVATSGPMSSGQTPVTLTADLTGAKVLRLVTTGSATGSDGTTQYDHTDWAVPVLTCGNVDPASPVLPVERTLYSFETGTDSWSTANPPTTETLTQSGAFHTDGSYGLAVRTTVDGNWFGLHLDTPLDLSGATAIKYDVRTGSVGTSGEIAIQVGDTTSWCQGGLWSWTGPNSSRTITEQFSKISCPSGVTLDLTQVRGIWVFLNSGGENYIDNIRVG